MATTEDVLHEKLDKLEIAHILPHDKLLDIDLPVQLNPFFENDLKDTVSDNKLNKSTGTLSLKTTRTNIVNCRRCRCRRASESALDKLKHTCNAAFDAGDCPKIPPNSALKQTLKKSTSTSVGDRGNRKVLLREPVLKALQTCLHPHSNGRRKLLVTANTSLPTTISESPLKTKGMSDFRDLIDECQNLLAEDVAFSGRLNQICLSNRNSKNFTTMQTPKLQSNKFCNNGRSLQNTPSLSLPSTNVILSENHYDPHAMLQAPLSSSNINSTNSQQRFSNISTLSPEHDSNHSRCNATSCSQEAGNSAAAAACDDVTIDELASYFDTFVHIPKKMSTMAEMMYI